jgi:hypothetical protein
MESLYDDFTIQRLTVFRVANLNIDFILPIRKPNNHLHACIYEHYTIIEFKINPFKL